MALSEWSDGNERNVTVALQTLREQQLDYAISKQDADLLERLQITMKQDAEVQARALDVQVGGQHYKSRGIQPVQYIHANGLDFFEGSAIKYITRWRQKGGKADLDKAIHFLEMLKELEPDT